MMKSSYHTHTRWCRHAKGNIEDYIREAIRLELDLFAICDHVFDDNSFGPRASWSEYDAYLSDVKNAENKYGKDIRLIRSIEAEYYPDAMNKYREMKERDDFSVWILGQHESSDRMIDFFEYDEDLDGMMKRYTEDVIEGLETGFFDILAHPDLLMMFYREPTPYFLECMDRIFMTCEKMNVAVEINANGIRGNKCYPNLEAFELSKKYNIRYIVSSDAHNPDFLYDDAVRKAEEFADKLGIEISDFI